MSRRTQAIWALEMRGEKGHSRTLSATLNAAHLLLSSKKGHDLSPRKPLSVAICQMIRSKKCTRAGHHSCLAVVRAD